MIRLILIIAILLALLITFKQIQNTPPEKRKKLLIKVGITVTAAIVLLLALTGRIHWIGGLIAALVPILRGSFPYLLKYLPILQRFTQQQTTSETNTPPPASVNLTIDEAYQVLGLEKGADKAANTKNAPR